MNLREYDLRRMGREEGIAIGEQRGITIGEQRGIETNKLDNARNMLADNVAVERIARYTGLPLETVRERACPKNCVNGYVRLSRLEPVCQIVWQIDLLLKPNF